MLVSVCLPSVSWAVSVLLTPEFAGPGSREPQRRPAPAQAPPPARPGPAPARPGPAPARLRPPVQAPPPRPRSAGAVPVASLTGPLCHLLAAEAQAWRMRSGKSGRSGRAGLGSRSPLQTSDPRRLPGAHPPSEQREKPTPGQNEATATLEAAPKRKGPSDSRGRRQPSEDHGARLP